jgi:hypothetical protein
VLRGATHDPPFVKGAQSGAPEKSERNAAGLAASTCAEDKAAEVVLPPLLIPNSLGHWFGYVRRLGSFRALHDLKFYRISFLERPISIADDRGVMYENIGPIFTPYESVTLRIIKPLNGSLHFVSPLAGDQHFYSWGGSETNRRHEHELRGVYQNGFLFRYGKNSRLCIFIQKTVLNGWWGTLP